MTEYTRREKAMLRNLWRSSYWMVRVCADGSLEAKEKAGSPWTMVKTPEETRLALNEKRGG